MPYVFPMLCIYRDLNYVRNNVQLMFQNVFESNKETISSTRIKPMHMHGQIGCSRMVFQFQLGFCRFGAANTTNYMMQSHHFHFYGTS